MAVAIFGAEKKRLHTVIPIVSGFVFMKNTPYAYLFCAVALAGLPLVSVSAPAHTDDEVSAAVLKKYDLNHDGVLADSEKAAWLADKEKEKRAREARRAEDLARYDADKDGKLSQEERAARKADIEKTREEKKAEKNARKAERAAAADAKKLARYDKNKNGVLDEDELAASKADKERRQAAAEKRKETAAAAKQSAGAAGDGPQDPQHE
jgi:Ca2+-binding EF-hand superfamily protein